MKFSLLLFFLCSLVACKETTVPKHKFVAKYLERAIDSTLAKHNFNGVILITQGKDILYSIAKGFSNLESQTPLKLDDQFVIGSVSKQITAVLVLRAFENGKLQLEDKLHVYLPQINQPWTKKISIHHLLTHTHGITSLEDTLVFSPGSKFQYSQLGYNLLANILETIYNQSFEDLATELFQQYGFKNSYHPNNKEYKNLVKGYEQASDGTLFFTPHSLENYPAAGSFISTAQDLNQWNQFLFKEKLVKKETLKRMRTKYATRAHPIFDSIDYGYGLLFNDGEQEKIQVGALGYAPGFVTACYYYPTMDVSLVILGNTTRHLPNFKETFKVHTSIMDFVKFSIQ